MTIRRVEVKRYGGPEVLDLVETPVPVPGPGEARVRVRAAGVSMADVLMREGVYPAWEGRPRAPFTPGWDVVGTVEALGPGTTGPAPGTRVVALCKVGGYAEALLLPTASLVPVPAGVDDAEAVTLVLNYVTAWQMLHRVARVRPGARILVDGAAGGVGSAILELGRTLGVEAYGTASPAKHPFVRALGARPIDYHREDVARRVRRETGGGVDVAFDGVGGWHLVGTLGALRPGGLAVGYGISAVAPKRLGRTAMALAGFGAAFALAPLRRRRLVSYSISRMRRRRPDWFREDLGALLERLAAGGVRPTVAARLPLAEAAEAHVRLGRGEVRGRIVLVPDRL